MNLVEHTQHSFIDQNFTSKILPYQQIAPPRNLGGEEQARSPLIFSAPHAGKLYCAELFRPKNINAAQQFEETGTERISSFLSNTKRPAVIAQAARAVIDVNRPATALDTKLHDNASKQNDVYTRYVDAGYGVIPRLDVHRKPLHEHAVSLDLAQQLIDTHHRPYHALLARHIQKAVQLHRHILLIDIHSMPDERHNRKLPDIVFGNIHGATMPDWMVQKIEDEMRTTPFSWGWNTPYAGGYITRHYGLNLDNKTQTISTLQIECNRALFTDKKGVDDAVMYIIAEALNSLCTMLEESLSDR